MKLGVFVASLNFDTKEEFENIYYMPMGLGRSEGEGVIFIATKEE